MSTVRDLVRDSLLTIGALASGENIPAVAMSDAIRALNRMLNSWSIDGFLVYQNVREVFPLVVAKSSYTIGVGGDFDTSRPTNIFNVTIFDGTFEHPVRILTRTQWADTTAKSIQTDYVCAVFLQDTYPLQTMNVYPVPSSVRNLGIYSKKPLISFDSANDEVSLPPGYEEAIVYNLAGRLCPQYGKVMTPEIAAVANESLAIIKRQNIKPVVMKSDVKTSDGIYNFNTGEYE